MSSGMVSVFFFSYSLIYFFRGIIIGSQSLIEGISWKILPQNVIDLSIVHKKRVSVLSLNL